MQPLADLVRLSLNQATTQRWSLREGVEVCARAGAIGVWRDKLAEIGLTQAARLMQDTGLCVSSIMSARHSRLLAPTWRDDDQL